MPLLSRTSYTILILVAFFTMTATAIGIWRGSRSIPIVPADPIKTNTSWETKNIPSATKFTSNQQAQGMLMSLLQAGKRNEKKDITFLISCLLDRRMLPAAPEMPAKSDATTQTTPPFPTELPDLFKQNQKRKRWVTVSSIAKEMLVASSPKSIQPLIQNLKSIQANHPKSHESWSVKELRKLQATIDAISNIQLHYLRKETTAPSAPPILFIGTSRTGKTDNSSKTIRTEPFGIICCKDNELNAASARLTEGHMPQLEVTPENIEAVIKDLSLTTSELAGQEIKPLNTPNTQK